jgi:hypothetical protein
MSDRKAVVADYIDGFCRNDHINVDDTGNALFAAPTDGDAA